MIQVISTKNFEKKFAKLPVKIKTQLGLRLQLFIQNPRNILLNNHALAGIYEGYRSINITGDFRLIYEEIDSSVVRLIDIGTHSELYE